MKILLIRNKKTRQIIATGVYINRNEVVPFTEIFSHEDRSYRNYLETKFCHSNVQDFKNTFKNKNTIAQEVIING